MVIKTNSPEHKITRKLRGHEKRLSDLEEDRTTNVDATLIRRIDEGAVSSVEVTVTAVDDPVLQYDDPDSGYERSEWS